MIRLISWNVNGLRACCDKGFRDAFLALDADFFCLQHIFERFYKGKDSDGKSFGIGLALSRMIIAGQKGTVKAENRKNAGAMFTLRFYKGTV